MRTTVPSLMLCLTVAGVSAETTPYLGCVVLPSDGIPRIPRPLVYNILNFQKVNASPEYCARACRSGNHHFDDGFGNDYPLVALDDYSCFCGFQLLHGVKLVHDTFCTDKCTGDDSASCGGHNAFSLYGDEQFLSAPGYLAGLTFDWCYEFDEAKYTGPKYTDANRMTVNSCADFCVRKHGKNGMALDKDDNCYCTHADRDIDIRTGADFEYYCNHPCPGDKRQSCGGGGSRKGYVSHWIFNP